MAHRRQTKRSPVFPSNSLVASAVRFNKKSASIYHGAKQWQIEAYRHYKICGEARYAARFMGHSLGKCVLNIKKPSADGNKVVKDGTAVDLLNALFNGSQGQSQMLESIGVHFAIAGECYLIGRKVDGADYWEIASVTEVSKVGVKWSLKYDDGQPDIELDEDENVIIRLWLSSPEKRIEADSPFRSLLPILNEIEWLTLSIFGQITSRLAGAGLLLLPSEMDFPKPPPVEGQEQAITSDAEGFMMVLGDAMLIPLQDPTSPASRIPVTLTAPGEMLQYVRHLTFWSELDSVSMDMRTEAIRRFALGMDMPPEQILGMSGGGTGGGEGTGVSHWGAWQIEESTIKIHVEPMMDLLVSALTVSYLRPLLDEESADGRPSDELVGYDTSNLRLRPDRSQESMELYDRGEIDGEALRRENGLSEDDRPDDAEFKLWILKKIASGSATPEQVNGALKQLGIDLGPEASHDESDNQTRESRPAPSLEDHPPKREAPQASTAKLAACEGLVFRALEKAGNRLRQKGAQPPGVPSYQTHCHVKANGQTAALLSDFNSYAPQVLEGIADVDVTVELLERFCNTLILEQSPYERSRLVEWLALGEKA